MLYSLGRRAALALSHRPRHLIFPLNDLSLLKPRRESKTLLAPFHPLEKVSVGEGLVVSRCSSSRPMNALAAGAAVAPAEPGREGADLHADKTWRSA